MHALWRDRVKVAERAGMEPDPIRTREVAEELAQSLGQPLTEGFRITVRGALSTLERRHSATIEEVEVAGGQAYWMPASAVDAGAAPSFWVRRDTERVVEAVRRARRDDRPAVSASEVEAEIAKEPSLALHCAGGVKRALESAARADLNAVDGPRVRRVQRLVRAGAIGSRPYYALSEDGEAGQAYMTFLRLERRYSRLDIESRAREIGACRMPLVRRARLVQLQEEVLRLRAAYDRAQRSDSLDRSLRAIAREREVELGTRYPRAGELDFKRGPASVRDVAPQTMLPGEVRELVECIAPRGAVRLHGGGLNGYLNGVRKLRNPEFLYPTAPLASQRSRYRLDRTDVLVRLATDLGGSVCIRAGATAATQLGRLRDSAPLLETLNTDDLADRLMAVKCIAFLGGEEVLEALHFAAQHDSTAGVRRVALWAYGFAGGPERDALARQRAAADPDARVRAFAREVASDHGEARWWRM